VLGQPLVDRPPAKFAVSYESLPIAVDVLGSDRLERRVPTELRDQVAIELAAVPCTVDGLRLRSSRT